MIFNSLSYFLFLPFVYLGFTWSASVDYSHYRRSVAQRLLAEIYRLTTTGPRR